MCIRDRYVPSAVARFRDLPAANGGVADVTEHCVQTNSDVVPWQRGQTLSMHVSRCERGDKSLK